MSVETRCTACGFTVEGPLRETKHLFADHARLDHRHGLARFLLGDYRDPGERAEKRLHREHAVGYIFPFDERIEMLRNDLYEEFRLKPLKD